MKLLKYLPVILLVPYLALMFYRAPQLADALIIVALCGVFGFDKYMTRLERKDPPRSEEIDKLRDELEIESIKSTIQNLEIQRNLAEVRRDSMSAGATNEQRRFQF